MCLEKVGDPDGHSLLVEAEGLLEDEVAVVGEGEVEEAGGQAVGEDEEEGVGYLAGKPCWEVGEQPCSCYLPEFWVDVVVDYCKVQRLGYQAVDQPELRFCATVGLRFVVRGLIDFILKGFGDAGGGEDFVLAVGEEAVQEELA